MTPPTVMSRAEVDEITLAEIAEACNVPAAEIEDVYACIPQQVDQISEKRSEVYHFILSFGQAADIDRWCEAVRQVVSLNSILRTRLVQCRLGIVQVVTSEEHVTERRSGDIAQYLYGEGSDAYRSRLGVPLFHSMFIDRSFVAIMHHAIMDYWSLNTLFSVDAANVYFGHPPTKRPAFKEFVAHCVSIDESAAKSFWAPRFKGVPAVFPRIDPDFSPHPDRHLNRKIALKRVSNRFSPSHLSLFAEVAWALTASVYTDSESVAYGLVLSCRSSALNGVETTLGPTVAEVPVQVDLRRNMTIEQLIKDRATSMRQLTKDPAFLHYGIPRIGTLSEAAQTASGFQSMLNVVPPPPVDLSTYAEDAKSVRLDRIIWQVQGCTFSLMVMCRILDDEISVETKYDRAIICERQLHRVLGQFEHMLHLLIEAPSQTKLDKLQRLNSFDCSEILLWNSRVPEAVGKYVHEVFSTQARSQPEVVAVKASDGCATYSEMEQMSDCLAHELRRRGMLPGKLVAFIFEKSLWAIVAILGIMKAGGVCIPIDKDEAYDCKAAIVSSLNLKIILASSTQYASSVNLAPDVFAVNVESTSKLPGVAGPPDIGTSSPENPAYISFTSGSTGNPKGVILEHRCLVSSLTSLAQRLDWQPGCRMLQLAPYVSNISICEIFGALLFGGCLCIPSEADESHLSDFVESTKVSWALLTPSVIRTISPGDVPSLQSLLSIGEPIDAEATKTWGEALHLFNGWGACEASILSTIADLRPNSLYSNSIGTPVGCAVWIVNPQNTHELAPIGSVGELLIEGPGVAKSYLNDQVKTATSFIAPPSWAASCPRNSTRFYRTGDLAKYNADGSISFIGRQDNRIKLRGQTVQLEELERVIVGCRKVRDVLTLSKIDAGRTQLVAVVCLADPQLPRRSVLQMLSGAHAKVAEQQIDSIRMYARSRLPSNMVPDLWLAIEQLPRTASQKLDRPAIRKWLKSIRY